MVLSFHEFVAAVLFQVSLDRLVSRASMILPANSVLTVPDAGTFLSVVTAIRYFSATGVLNPPADLSLVWDLCLDDMWTQVTRDICKPFTDYP